MKKLLLLVETPFSRRDYERFGVEVLEKFFTVDVFDLTEWIRPTFAEKYSDVVFHYSGRHAFKRFEDLRDALKAGGYDFVIDYTDASNRIARVHEILKKLHIPRCIVAAGPLPESRPSLWLRLRALRHRTRKFGLIFDFLRQKMGPSSKYDAPDYALLAGSASTTGRALPGGAQAKPIWAHSLDYDIFRRVRDLPAPVERYAVYADEDLAYHSDFAALHIKPMVTPGKFYPAVMAYFDMLESRTGLKVVIAAHPRSRWDLRADLLTGRDAVYGKTAELIRGAQLVFAHASTSISFAVLSDVPLALLTSDELNNSFYSDEIRVRERLFGVSAINIDHLDQKDFDLPHLMRVNHAAYADYREKYIKTAGTPDLPSWEIFAQAISAELEASPNRVTTEPGLSPVPR
jgi:hypothetical protein